MNNTRFATAVHIMIILAKLPDEWVSSELIANSININPVVVRKELIVLKEAGLLTSRKGKNGGCKIVGKAEDIRISDIYAAIKNSEVLGRKIKNPNPRCNIGKKINENLNELFAETDRVVLTYLEKRTLAGFLEKFE